MIAGGNPLTEGLCPWLQEPLTRLESARSEGRLAHGWLLAGPAGIGKINLALAAARRILEPGWQPGPLGPREAAEAMLDRHEPGDHHPDLHWVHPEPGKRTLRVDQIRETIDDLSLTSLSGCGKVVILEPADAMTSAAANALLKTLEEPTAGTYLFLISHQPGRLPATIRSRCQLLPIPRPPNSVVAGWLADRDEAIATGDWETLLALADGAPFQALALYSGEFMSKNNKLEEIFDSISRNKLDPQTVADEWLKGDLELSLIWLAARLRWAIRGRMAPHAWNPITDLTSDRLHNAWRALTLRTLFQRLQSTEALLRQLGGGINADLATRALLLGFRA